MVSVVIIDRDGESRRLECDCGVSIMEVLRGNDLEVDGTCGGMAYCASCHVYVETKDLASLPPADDTELQTIEGLVNGKDNSRLGCQIEVSEAISDIRLTLAPAEI